MAKNLPSDAATGRVYKMIRDRRIAHEFPPGQPIRLSPLADELGVSTTPVREALVRLVGEGLMLMTPQTGFYPNYPAERELRDLYELNRLMLTFAIQLQQSASTSSKSTLASKMPKIFSVFDDESEQPRPAASSVVRITGDLFFQIAQRSGNSETPHVIQRNNNLLHHVRLQECRLITNAASEILGLCQLFYAQRHDDLICGVDVYHQRRLALVFELTNEGERALP